MERFHARKWCQLYTHNTLLCCAIFELQFLQEGKLDMQEQRRCGQLSGCQNHANADAQKFVGIQPGVPTAPWKNLLCGGLAGITSVTFTYPLDLVRTRLSVQTADFSGLTEAEKKNMPGMWRIMVNVYKTEGGILALYGGYIPTIAGVAPYVSKSPFIVHVPPTDTSRSVLTS